MQLIVCILLLCLLCLPEKDPSGSKRCNDCLDFFFNAFEVCFNLLINLLNTSFT